MTDIDVSVAVPEEINVSVEAAEEINVSIEGGVSPTNLTGLADVTIDAPINSQHLIYNSTTEVWENSNSTAGSSIWGDITGTISNQTDLQAALNAKEEDLTFSTGLTRVSDTITVNDSELTLSASQISDFDTEVSNNISVDANTTHRGLTNDPHNVTATQVGLGNVTDVSTDNTAYNSTSWDSNSDAATKNAIRDKIETMDTAIGLNTSKDTNVSTNITVVEAPTNVEIQSSDGTNDTIAAANGTNAGVMTTTMYDEHVVNYGKTTNATHTGEVSGATALTVEPAAVTGKTAVTALGADYVLISDTSDAGNLKKALISDFASAGGDMAAATYDPNTVADDVFDMDNMVQGSTNFHLTSAEHTVVRNTSNTNTGDQTISDATISTTDITTNDVSTTKHGFAPKGNGSATSFLNGLGAYSTPSGGGNVSASGTPGDNDFAKFVNATDIEGRSYSEVRTDLNIEDGADVTDVTNVTAAGAAMSGGAFHDGFSDFVANEHLDWTTDRGATNIHAGNYTNTTYTAGDFAHNDLTGLNDGSNYEHITQTQKDALHAESHTVASHSDTTATGTELNILTGGGDTTLHDHDGISENTTHRGSDGSDHSDVVTNNAKVSNANHSGDATGSTALTLATVNSNVGSYTNANITVNAKGLVTAAANGTGGSGGISWNEITGTSQGASVDNGYITNNAGLVTVTLPDTAALGSVVRIAGLGAGGWKLAQNASEYIYFGNTTTTTGTGGYLGSTHSKDSIELICVVANTGWSVISSVGNINVT